MAPFLFILLACRSGQGSDTDTDTDAVPVDTDIWGCDFCISTRPDRFEESRLVATTLSAGCFWGHGFDPFPPPRVMIDGVEVLQAGGNGGTCFGSENLPFHTRSGELWVEQGTDLDSDGVEDPGSARQTNHLPVVTAPWVTGVDVDRAATGDLVTVSLDNIPLRVSWGLVTRGCDVDVLSTNPEEAVFTPLWSSWGTDCEIAVEAGRVEAATGAPAVVPADAPHVEVLPTLHWGCYARVGEPCVVVGTGFGQPDGDPTTNTPWVPGQPVELAIDGVPYFPQGSDHWGPNEVAFTMPDLAAGTHTFTLTTAGGHVVAGEVATLGWSRHPITASGGFSYDHEGTLFAAEMGWIAPPFGALETRQIAFAVAMDGAQLAQVHGIPHPEAPFASPTHAVGLIGDLDGCSRVRATGARDALDLVSNDPHFAVAGRARGTPPAVIDWDGLPARTCEPGLTVRARGEAAPGQYPAFDLDLLGPNDHMVVGGMARFVFDDQPPMPDPLGRPDRYVPLLAIRDDLALTTDIQVLFGDPPTPLYAAPLDGRGTLHEAGELVYLAGGEPGFDGILHELGWSSERTIELPLPGLTPDRMPAFSGSTDGRLWSLVIEPTGVASVRVWDPVASAWSLHSVVPPDIVGADEATLAVDPTVHAVNDLAIYGSSPVLATYRTVPTGVRLVVVAWDGSGWVDVGEPLNGLREETEACLPHETGNVPPHPACERGEGRYAVLGLREVEDVPASARLLTTDDAIYVRYDTDDGLTLRSQVAGFHLPEVGP